MFSKSKAGPGYIVLNVIRVLNVIALLTVVVASWVMLVKTVQTSNFFFFDGVSHFITSSIGIFLIVSEINLFRSYFAHHWPMLSAESGFVFLGLTMIVLGFNILGNLNKNATSQESLGLPMWRIVIASGILSSLMGFFNIVATYVFCDSKNGITGRQVRSKGAAIPMNPSSKSNFSVSSGSMRRPQSPILPSYKPPTEDRRKSRFGIRLPIRMSGISKPVVQDQEQFSKWESRSSPLVPDVQRPPTALHPIHQHEGVPAYPPPPSSRYSVASNVPQF